MTDVSESYLESLRDRAEFAEETLTAEQREHDVTRRHRDTLQTQCEDMQSEMETETKLNNAALKPSAKVLQQDQEDEMACMAEEVDGLKKKLSETLSHAVILADANGDLIREISTLQYSAETQTCYMQQVDAACKAAEAKVIEQRKEIEALKSGEDLWICPTAYGCVVLCDHKEPHKKTSQCQRKCRLLDAPMPPCVKVNTCKECATMREEIINRDAVILEQERKADRTDEIMRTAFEQLNKLRGCVEKRNAVTEKHNSYIVMLSCKARDMQTPTTKHACTWYNVCTISSKTSYACIANEGQHCGRKREIDAKHGAMQ